MLSQKYIEHNNQTILWNTIPRVELLNDVFKATAAGKIAWFKSAIESIYSAIPTHIKSQPELLHMKNKETIAYMVENLKTMKNTISNRSSPSSIIVAPAPSMQNHFVGESTPTTIYSRNGTQNRSDAFSMNVSERQKEYDNMVKKPLPPTENIFENKIEDTAISNMDELIKQHMKQRESEINIYAAAPTSANALTSSSLDNSISSSRHTLPAIHIESSVPKHNESSSDKKIAWASDVLNAIMELKQEIGEIKTMLSEIKSSTK